MAVKIFVPLGSFPEALRRKLREFLPYLSFDLHVIGGLNQNLFGYLSTVNVFSLAPSGGTYFTLPSYPLFSSGSEIPLLCLLNISPLLHLSSHILVIIHGRALVINGVG